MTQDEIIEMAKQAGFQHPNPHDGYMGLAYDRREGAEIGSSLEAFANLVAAKEREACAQLCEKRLGPTATDFYGKTYAAAIRARKETV